MKFNVETLYANSVPQEVELSLGLSYPDWCELQKRPEFQRLVEYLDRSESQEKSCKAITEALGVPCKIIPMASGACWIPSAQDGGNDIQQPRKMLREDAQNKRHDRNDELRDRELVLKGLLAFGLGFLTARFLSRKEEST